MPFVMRLRDALEPFSRPGEDLPGLLKDLRLPVLNRLTRDFATLAHAHQEPPAFANNGGPWTTWLMLAGRGAGKTRAGAEWVRAQAAGEAPYAERRCLSIALVGETEHDVREVMIEGPAGLLSVCPRGEKPQWTASRRRLEWPNGAVAYAFSAEDPEQLRGPQFDAAWCDELAKWRHSDATFDMLQFGLRLGERPRQLVTTTPRPIPLIKRLLADPRTAVTRASTHANATFLAPSFIDAVIGRYAGTRLGRQEIDGVLLEDVPGSLWPAALVEHCRGAAPAAEALRRVVVGVDPPASAEGTCGIVVCGLDAEGVGHVLADHSAGGLSPEGWARAVAAAAEAHGADRVVAEKNQGGDMVGAVLRSAGVALPISLVSASRGKVARAEPIAGLFEAGKARFAGRFPELEDELGRLVAGGETPEPSPDRADAMVWALWALLVRRRAEPRVHVF
jgi:phage terminase large subunit-like protein